MAPHRRNGSQYGLFMLVSQMFQFGVKNIPPVTLALLAGQIAIFLEVFPQFFPSAHGVCMSSYLVAMHRDWRRMVLGTFYHAHDMHLYFNMLSLLYKGTSLERKFGSSYFAYLIAVFTGLTSMTYVGIGLALSHVLQDENYLLSCAVGFSGVLFALKVLTTYYAPPETKYVMGIIPVQYKYIYWIELVLIQLATPNASFVGHLAGILVGVFYIYGPLKALMDSFLAPGAGLSRQSSFDGRTPPPQPSPFGSRLFGRGSPPASPSPDTTRYHDPSYRSSFLQGRGSTASAARPQLFDRSQNYNTYTGGLSEEEQYRQAMQESQRPHEESPSTSRMYPDLDELRNRRSNFYHQRF